jgi:hypothetical protein
VTVPRILDNGVRELGLSAEDLQLLLETNPRAAIGLA